MATIQAPTVVFQAIAFDTENAFHPLLRYCSFVGLKGVVKGATTEISPVKDYSLLTWERVKALTEVGGEVLGYPAWFVVDPAEYDEAVPEAIAHEVEGDDPQTWRQWGLSNHPHVETESGWFVATNAYGSPLPATVVAAVESSVDGVTVADTVAYKAANPAATIE